MLLLHLCDVDVMMIPFVVGSCSQQCGTLESTDQESTSGELVTGAPL